MSGTTSTTPSKFIVVFKKVLLSIALGLPALALGVLWTSIAGSNANQYNLSFLLGVIGPLALAIAILGSVWGGNHSTGNVGGPLIAIGGWVIFVVFLIVAFALIIEARTFLVGSFFWGVLDFAVILAAGAVLFVHGVLFNKINK